MSTRTGRWLLVLALVAGCAPAARMARPAHAPEPVWQTCTAEADRLSGTGLAGLEPVPLATTPGPVGVGMAGGAVLGLAGRALSDAIAPDPDTATAWRWNHVMRLCLEDRGIRLP